MGSECRTHCIVLNQETHSSNGMNHTLLYYPLQRGWKELFMPGMVISCPLDILFLMSPTSSVRLEMHSEHSIGKTAATLPVTAFSMLFSDIFVLFHARVFPFRCTASRL